MKDTLFNTEDLFAILDTEAVLYFATALVLLALAKFLNDLFVPYKLSDQLTKHDNRAIALSFAGYLFGVSIIFAGIMGFPSAIKTAENEFMFMLKDMGSTVLWSLIGTLLLLSSRVVNDKLLLPKFSNVKELEQDKNVGVGAVQAGTYIATALIVTGSLAGEGQGGFLLALGMALLYFVISQLIFIVFGWLYEKVSFFNLHEELEHDNAAAGVGYGMNLVALGILISEYLKVYDSVLGLAAWTALGAIALVICRYIVDRFFLPGDLLDDEIKHDRNWGAALIEGVIAIGLALILTQTFIA
jgi:uncharacterized membrane protein YjfL (UPF0719 family)